MDALTIVELICFLLGIILLFSIAVLLLVLARVLEDLQSDANNKSGDKKLK